MPVVHLEAVGSISNVSCWNITAGCRQQLGQCCMVLTHRNCHPMNGHSHMESWSMREKQGGKVNGQPNVMASERKTSRGWGWKPSNDGGDREERSQSMNRTSVKTVCRCVKNSREEGVNSVSHQGLLKCFSSYTELQPAHFAPALGWLAGSTMRPDSQLVCEQETH